jgi:hypothetical protein
MYRNRTVAISKPNNRQTFPPHLTFLGANMTGTVIEYYSYEGEVNVRRVYDSDE